MKQIPLSGGGFCVVDDIDFEYLNRIKWRGIKGYHTTYVYGYLSHKVSGERGMKVYMHRLIMKVSERNVYVDHRDSDGLNNTRSNLRICSAIENGMNQIKRKPTKLKSKGVSMQVTGRFSARIKASDKYLHLGTFQTEEDAARAYDEAAKVYYGEFARLNFP